MKHLIGISIALVCMACEKDPAITPTLPPSSLSDEISIWGQKFIDTIYAHAGNHSAFERETDQFPIHVRFWAHNEATNVKFYRSDSLNLADSLSLFHEWDVNIEMEPQGKFYRAAILDEVETDFLVRASFIASNTLFVAEAVRIRQSNKATNTKNVRDISVETTNGGRAFFNWVGAAVASNNNLIEIIDATGKTFCAVVCTDPSFLFHNLRNASHDFTPELHAPRLVHGQKYSAHIYMTDNAGWMRNYRTFGFVADSNNIHIIE